MPASPAWATTPSATATSTAAVAARCSSRKAPISAASAAKTMVMVAHDWAVERPYSVRPKTVMATMARPLSTDRAAPDQRDTLPIGRVRAAAASSASAP